jgi:hypothetical protein
VLGASLSVPLEAGGREAAVSGSLLPQAASDSAMHSASKSAEIFFMIVLLFDLPVYMCLVHSFPALASIFPTNPMPGPCPVVPVPWAQINGTEDNRFLQGSFFDPRIYILLKTAFCHGLSASISTKIPLSAVSKGKDREGATAAPPGPVWSF